MNPEGRYPFRGELESLKEGADFDIKKLKVPEETVELAGGREREFSTLEYAITEYFDEGGKNHEAFVKLKQFYESAQKELGDFLPRAFFVEGEPSNPDRQGKSFYVVQKFDNPEFNATAKKLDELNTKEFSADFLNQLLLIQEKINTFIERHSQEVPSDWIDASALDPKKFKENIVHSPEITQTRIVNLFRLNPEVAKVAIGSRGKFESSVDRLRLLKMLGLANLVDKINWAIERSAASEWVRGQGVHWNLSKEKTAKFEKEGKRVIALTFDDGPNEETLKLLDVLKKLNVKATFFLVGALIPGREHIVKRIVEEGHDVGVHEWEHEMPQMSGGVKEYAKRFVGPREDLGSVKKTAEIIEKVTGVKPVLGRVAGAHGTVDSLREFQAMGLEIIHSDPLDPLTISPRKDLTVDKLLKIAKLTRRNRKIALFHIGNILQGRREIQKSDIDYEKGEVYPPDEMLKMINLYIEDSKKRGYEFVKVKDYI